MYICKANASFDVLYVTTLFGLFVLKTNVEFSIC